MLKEAGKSSKKHAAQNAAESWKERCCKGPPAAFCFFINSNKSGRTGPVHQGKEHDAYSRGPGPAICSEDLF